MLQFKIHTLIIFYQTYFNIKTSLKIYNSLDTVLQHIPNSYIYANGKIIILITFNYYGAKQIYLVISKF